ncbi:MULTISPECIES: hypothetical protein [Streptococcus]|uniref:hypothetical protein n=1 Tax=Streptococcus TaxID=1301 RepID=UPI000370D7C6|nr:hypothetical protein [Streptococcus entericus]
MKKILNQAVLQLFFVDLVVVSALYYKEQFSLQATLFYGFFLFLFHGVIVIRSLYNKFYDEFYDDYSKK